jgi:hypothetical protein
VAALLTDLIATSNTPPVAPLVFPAAQQSNKSLAEVSADLDRWERATRDPSEVNDISALRMRITAIEKHLGIEKKIAA